MAARAKAHLPNPALLTWARETAGYPVPELAEKIGRKPEDIEAWESGADAPTFPQLAKLAQQTHRSVAALYLPAIPTAPPLPADFRLLPAASRPDFSPEARLAFRRLRNALEDWAALRELSGDCMALPLPEFGLGTGAIEAGAALRDWLGVSVADQVACPHEYAAMDLWTAALFEKGVLVRKFPVEPAEMRGFSMLHSGLGGVGLSTKDAAIARVFSLFHEVAHVCLREPGVSGDPMGRREPDIRPVARVEQFCNAVAAEFLLPRHVPEVVDALRNAARDFGSESARKCGARFGVSRFVVARRLLDLGLLDDSAYWGAVDAWSQLSAPVAGAGGGNYYDNKLSEVGKPFAAAVFDAMDRGLLPAHDALRVLDVGKTTTLEGLRTRLAEPREVKSRSRRRKRVA